MALLLGRCETTDTGAAQLLADLGPKIGAGMSTFEEVWVVHLSKVDKWLQFLDFP